MNIDHAKIRRESMRWLILLTLQNARPLGSPEDLVLVIAQTMWSDASLRELRLELDYLADRGLVDLRKEPGGGRWHGELTRDGVDVVEYTVECDPGINRPDKYWAK